MQGNQKLICGSAKCFSAGKQRIHMKMDRHDSTVVETGAMQTERGTHDDKERNIVKTFL